MKKRACSYGFWRDWRCSWREEGEKSYKKRKNRVRTVEAKPEATRRFLNMRKEKDMEPRRSSRRSKEYIESEGFSFCFWKMESDLIFRSIAL